MPEKAPVNAIQSGAPCPFCGEGPLDPSPSGKHLVCRKCGRVVVIERKRPPTEPRKTD